MLLEYTIEDVEITKRVNVHVRVTHYSPYVPANTSGHPDNWSPAENEELEFDFCDEYGNEIVVDEDELSERILFQIRGEL